MSVKVGPMTVMEYDLDTMVESVHVFCECGWRGDYRTLERAEQKMTEHGLRKHKIQIMWKSGEALGKGE
jgi:hypothetical protein